MGNAGWYDSPNEPGLLRWWDGVQWTIHVQPRAIAGDSEAGVASRQPDPASGADAPLEQQVRQALEARCAGFDDSYGFFYHPRADGTCRLRVVSFVGPQGNRTMNSRWYYLGTSANTPATVFALICGLVQSGALVGNIAAEPALPPGVYEAWRGNLLHQVIMSDPSIVGDVDDIEDYEFVWYPNVPLGNEDVGLLEVGNTEIDRWGAIPLTEEMNVLQAVVIMSVQTIKRGVLG